MPAWDIQTFTISIMSICIAAILVSILMYGNWLCRGISISFALCQGNQVLNLHHILPWVQAFSVLIPMLTSGEKKYFCARLVRRDRVYFLTASSIAPWQLASLLVPGLNMRSTTGPILALRSYTGLPTPITWMM